MKTATREYRLRRGEGPAGLELANKTWRPLQPSEVRVRMHAVSLNNRDLSIAQASADGPAIVPCSDGAGQVIEVGSEVRRWRVGERVFATFYPDWVDGTPTEEVVAVGLGGGRLPGMLAEEVVLGEHAFVRIPDGMSYLDASTLPCAGVTAWNALFCVARPAPGDSVLLLGTGGVSIWALQLAKAAGLRVIITSSDARKLALMRSLGAHATINYREVPNWSAEVRRLTEGKGVDCVVEVGGRGTLSESIASTRAGGTIALVGGASGEFGGELPPFALIDGMQALIGVRVGSRKMAERLAAFASLQHLNPVIDRTFGFEKAAQAYEHLASGRHVGKVVITLD